MLQDRLRCCVTVKASDLLPLVLVCCVLQENKQLKAMLLALSSHRDVHGGSVSLPQPHRVGEVSEEEVAFVQTDIQSSTELSQQNPKAFKTVGGGWLRGWPLALHVSTLWGDTAHLEESSVISLLASPTMCDN